MSLHSAQSRTIAVALTGASGMPYGLRLVECLLAAGCRVWLLYSQVAQIVARQEMDLALPARPAEVEAMLAARFGADEMQRSLALITGYAAQQKLIPRAFLVDELFDDVTRALR